MRFLFICSVFAFCCLHSNCKPVAVSGASVCVCVLLFTAASLFILSSAFQSAPASVISAK